MFSSCLKASHRIWLHFSEFKKPIVWKWSFYGNEKWMAQARSLARPPYCTFPVQSVVLLTTADVGQYRTGRLSLRWTQLQRRSAFNTVISVEERKTRPPRGPPALSLLVPTHTKRRKPVMPPLAFYLEGSLFLPPCMDGERRLKWVLDDTNKRRQVVQLA